MKRKKIYIKQKSESNISESYKLNRKLKLEKKMNKNKITILSLKEYIYKQIKKNKYN